MCRYGVRLRSNTRGTRKNKTTTPVFLHGIFCRSCLQLDETASNAHEFCRKQSILIFRKTCLQVRLGGARASAASLTSGDINTYIYREMRHAKHKHRDGRFGDKRVVQGIRKSPRTAFSGPFSGFFELGEEIKLKK